MPQLQNVITDNMQILLKHLKTTFQGKKLKVHILSNWLQLNLYRVYNESELVLTWSNYKTQQSLIQIEIY